MRRFGLTVTMTPVVGFLLCGQLAIAQPTLPALHEDAQQPESPTPAAPTDGSSTPPGMLEATGVPVSIEASITLRYEYTTATDLTDQLQDDVVANGLRYRLRLGSNFGAPDALITGGIRISASQTPNPAVAFSPLGESLRPQDTGFDQWFITLRPFADRGLFSSYLIRQREEW